MRFSGEGDVLIDQPVLNLIADLVADFAEFVEALGWGTFEGSGIVKRPVEGFCDAGV